MSTGWWIILVIAVLLALMIAWINYVLRVK